MQSRWAQNLRLSFCVRNSCCRHSLYTLAGSCRGCIGQSHRTGDTPAETYGHKESISETLGLVICNVSTCIGMVRAQIILPLPRFRSLQEYSGSKEFAGKHVHAHGVVGSTHTKGSTQVTAEEQTFLQMS